MNEIDAIMRGLKYEIFHTFADGSSLVPADEERITQLEQLVGFRLPAMYRLFLRKYGGAYLDGAVFPKRPDTRLELQDGKWMPVGFFSAFYRETEQITVHDLPTGYNLLTDRLPATMLPIVEYNGGWYCLSCATDTDDRIYYFEADGYDEEFPEDSLFFVAGSFHEFLSSIQT